MEVLRNGGDRLLGKNCFGQFLIAGRQLGVRDTQPAQCRFQARTADAAIAGDETGRIARASRNNLFSNGVLVSLLVT